MSRKMQNSPYCEFDIWKDRTLWAAYFEAIFTFSFKLFKKYSYWYKNEIQTISKNWVQLNCWGEISKSFAKNFRIKDPSGPCGSYWIPDCCRHAFSFWSFQPMPVCAWIWLMRFHSRGFSPIWSKRINNQFYWAAVFIISGKRICTYCTCSETSAEVKEDPLKGKRG